jgi:hypothetical protein
LLTPFKLKKEDNWYFPDHRLVSRSFLHLCSYVGILRRVEILYPIRPEHINFYHEFSPVYFPEKEIDEAARSAISYAVGRATTLKEKYPNWGEIPLDALSSREVDCLVNHPNRYLIAGKDDYSYTHRLVATAFLASRGIELCI